MRSVIDGLIYDTEKAMQLASWQYGFSGDFEYVCETLYRTHKGNHFIVGEGGALTEYGRYTGHNEKTGGSRMWAVTQEQAIAWCEEYKQDAAIIKHFPEQVEVA